MKLIFITFLFFISALPAYAEDIASCENSDGYSYYSDRGAIANKNQSKWIKDKISDGRITLNQNSMGNFDLLFADATGHIFSSVAEGAKVIPISIDDKEISVLLIYPDLTETYIFQKTSYGSEVMYTQAKHSTVFPKVSAFVAKCNFLNIKAVKKTP